MRSPSIETPLLAKSGPAESSGSAVGARDAARHELRFPHYCARCLGAPDATFHYEQRDRNGLETRSSVVDVPICSECLAAVRAAKRRAVSLFVNATFGGVLAAVVAGMLWDWIGATWLAAAGATAGTMLFAVHAQRAVVCTIAGGLPRFENADYQMLFERVNGIEPIDSD
jgi:hypothetical protein